MAEKLIVIVVREDLDMSEGKRAAQITHAALRSNGVVDYTKERVVCRIKTCKSDEALGNLYTKCVVAEVPFGYQFDAGMNELEPDTPTALCVGPGDPEVVHKLTKKYRLMKG